MLQVENISSGYGKKQVLYDVSFEVKKGEVVLLTGGNGSGKSTILKVIFGLLPLWGGNVFFENNDLFRSSTFDMLKKGIVFIPQKNNCFEGLTVKENLSIAGSIYSKSELKNRIKDVWTLPKLYDYRNRTPFNLSGGEKQILAFGMALLHHPRLILFDEPFAGIDIGTTVHLKNNILDYRKKYGASFLIVEHKKHLSDIKDKEINIKLGSINY